MNMPKQKLPILPRPVKIRKVFQFKIRRRIMKIKLKILIFPVFLIILLVMIYFAIHVPIDLAKNINPKSVDRVYAEIYSDGYLIFKNEYLDTDESLIAEFIGSVKLDAPEGSFGYDYKLKLTLIGDKKGHDFWIYFNMDDGDAFPLTFLENDYIGKRPIEGYYILKNPFLENIFADFDETSLSQIRKYGFYFGNTRINNSFFDSGSAVLIPDALSKIRYKFYFDVKIAGQNSDIVCVVDPSADEVKIISHTHFNMPRMIWNQTNTSFIGNGQLNEIVNYFSRGYNSHNIHTEMVIEYDDFFNANPWNFDYKYNDGAIISRDGEINTLIIPGVEQPFWTRHYFWLNDESFIIQYKKDKADDLFTSTVFSSDGTFIRQYESGKKELKQVGYNGDIGVMRAKTSGSEYRYHIFDFSKDREICVLTDENYMDVFLYPPFLILNVGPGIFPKPHIAVVYNIQTGQVVYRLNSEKDGRSMMAGFIGAEIIK